MASLTKQTCGQLRAGKGTTTQTQNQNTTSNIGYDWKTPPETADIGKMRGFQFQHDPRIPYAFARSRQNMANTYQSPTGGYATPQMRDAVLRSGSRESAQQEAQALGEENYNLQFAKYGQLSDVAGKTAPRLVTTGGTSTGSGTTTVQQPFDLSGLISGAAGTGAMLM